MTMTTRMRNVELGLEDVHDSSSTVTSSARNGMTHFIRSLFWSAFFFIGVWFWRAVNSLSDSFLEKDFNSTPSSSSLCRGDYRHSYISAIRKGYRLTSDQQSTISQASSKNLNEMENPDADVYAAGASVSNEGAVGGAIASTNLERFMTLIQNPSTDDSGVDSEDDVFAPLNTRRCVSLPPERRKKKTTRITSEDRSQPRHYLDRSNIDEQATGFNATRFHNCSRGDMTVLYVNKIYVNQPQSLSISQVQHLACQTGGFGAAAYTTIGAPPSYTYADVYSQETDASWV